MDNLKKGDVVFIKKKQVLPIFTRDEIVFNHFVNKDIINVSISFDMLSQDVKKIGESQMQYEESNRYKLAQAIKKTGLKVGELSIAVNGNVNYFGNYHNKSRFNERGDISEARLNELLTDLRHAEREVLGIGAKTIEDENHISKETNSLIYRNSWDEDARKRLNDEMIKSLSNQSAKRPSNKPLFIGAAVVIFIVLILFILNNSQVV